MAEQRKFNLLAFLPIIIFAALIAAFFLPGLGRNDPSKLPSTRVGNPAPVLFLPDGAGRGFSDQTLRSGGVKLVNFWASWCGPCRVEHPNLMKLAEEGLPIYGINYRDNPANAARFIEGLGNPYKASIVDPKGRNGIEWGVTGMPETYLIDGDGMIIWHFRGPLTQRVIAEKLRPAIEAVQ